MAKKGACVIIIDQLIHKSQSLIYFLYVADDFDLLSWGHLISSDIVNLIAIKIKMS